MSEISNAVPTPPKLNAEEQQNPSPATPERVTYVVVDGENIDATLGMSVLGRRPQPEERPRWDRITAYAKELWEQPVRGLFFLNASNGQMPMSFVQALLAMGYTPIPLSGESHEKVVDIGIQRTLEVLNQREGDVLLASHDGDFLPQMSRLLSPGRKVGMLCFREFVNAQFSELEEEGLQFFDLEREVGAFTTMLPRIKIIPLEDFDPAKYL